MSETLGDDPLELVQRWYAEAVSAGAAMPDAMTLATASPDGTPSARVVLYKGVEDGALLFVSNYQSKKGRELALNPRAALVFFWPVLNRQARLEGEVEQASAERSDSYFAGRPRQSQLGAWASAQSEPVASRAELERRLSEVEARFAGRDVPRPSHWGVYRFTPRRIELWLGQDARLHDRFSYTRDGAAWHCQRLFP